MQFDVAFTPQHVNRKSLLVTFDVTADLSNSRCCVCCLNYFYTAIYCYISNEVGLL